MAFRPPPRRCRSRHQAPAAKGVNPASVSGQPQTPARRPSRPPARRPGTRSHQLQAQLLGSAAGFCHCPPCSAASRSRRRPTTAGRLRAHFLRLHALLREAGRVVGDRCEHLLYYIQARPSKSRETLDSLRRGARGDAGRRLPAVVGDSFLDDLAVDVRDVRYANGVSAGWRSRHGRAAAGKIVDYVGSNKVGHSAIDEKLKEKGITIRLDSFIDPGRVRQVTGVVRELTPKGYQYAEVKPEIKRVGGGPRPSICPSTSRRSKVRVRRHRLRRQPAGQRRHARRKMKENKGQGSSVSSLAAGRTRKRSSVKTPTRSSSTTATRATSPPGSDSRNWDHGGLGGRYSRSSSSAYRSPKASATRSATSTSRGTRS